jgi:uroporphyrinogen decarboxylase
MFTAEKEEDKMTQRERVICALEHRQSDLVPWTIDLTQMEHQKLIESNGNIDPYPSYCSHITSVSFSDMAELPDRPDYYKDHFGVVWNRTVDKDIGIVDSYRLTAPDVNKIPMMIPPFDELENERRFASFIAGTSREQFRIANLGFSLFERAWTLRGMDNLLMDMVENPEFVDALLSAVTDWNMKCIEFALQWDIDGMLFGDDWGMQRGLITGPQLWRRFIKPHLARMYGRVRQAGKFVLQHSCGDISEIYPDLVEIGLNAHQTFQPEIYDIVQIKKQYAGKLAFWGGVSTQRLLPFATPEQVQTETARIMSIMAKDGGFIAAPTHAVPPDVPVENIAAMIEVFHNQDKWLTL